MGSPVKLCPRERTLIGANKLNTPEAAYRHSYVTRYKGFMHAAVWSWRSYIISKRHLEQVKQLIKIFFEGPLNLELCRQTVPFIKTTNRFVLEYLEENREPHHMFCVTTRLGRLQTVS